MNKYLLNSIALACLLAVMTACGGGPPVPAPANSGNIGAEPVMNVPAAKCVYNIYVENSGSMDGYVKGKTEFEQSVYSYLSDIKISDICSEMNLYYINSKMHKQPSDVADFIEKLEPNTFKAKGGNRKTTDLSNIIGDILDSHGRDTVSILVSDFVFSPGSGVNADEYLLNQQIGIKNHFAYKLKSNPNLAMILYQLSSKFEGRYYDRNNTPYNINHQRPFYMLIIGDSYNLIKLSDEISKDKIKGSGVINSYSLSKAVSNAGYGVLPMPKIGSFNPDPAAPLTSIKGAKIDRRSPNAKFMVSIGVDFSKLLLDDDYLMDPSNYEISNKSFTISVDKAKNNTKYTHIVKLSLNPQMANLYKGPLTIQLLKKPSTWSETVTNPDDVGVQNITTDKTYGFKYLVGGIYDSYSSDKAYAKFNINIK